MLGKQLIYKTQNGKIIVSTRPIRTTKANESQANENAKNESGAPSDS